MPISLSIREAKSHLRREMRALRDAISAEERKERSRRIFQKLESLPLFRGADTILFYASFGSEVDTWEMMEKCRGYGKRIALPCVEEASGELMALEVQDFRRDLYPGYKGILEPQKMGSRQVRGEELGLITVPGLVFDLRGYRLGYGKGFYDRFLFRLSGKNIPSAGLAFDFQLVEALPVTSEDYSLDLIITEERIIRGEGAATLPCEGPPLK